jgi:RNA polymerase sigma-70 factor (ECF subfamily)
MAMTDNHADFADQLLAIQKGLYAYILTLIPQPEEATDVLQETNVVLWRDAGRFRPGTDFRAWAYRVAYYQVLGRRRKQNRDRLRFHESLLALLAEQAIGESAVEEEEALALRDCLDKLPPVDRKLICHRYDAGVSVKSMAADLHQPPGTLAVRLFRIRQTLLECIQEQISDEECKGATDGSPLSKSERPNPDTKRGNTA